MRPILIFLSSLLFACTHLTQQAPPVVSTAGISRSVEDVGKAVVRAQAANAVAGAAVADSRTLAERIEAKAVVVGKYWDEAK